MKFETDMIQFDNISEPAGEKLLLIDRIEQMHGDIFSRIELPTQGKWEVAYRLYESFKSLYCDILFTNDDVAPMEHACHVSLAGNDYTAGMYFADGEPLSRCQIRTTIPQIHKLTKPRWDQVLDALPTPEQLKFAFDGIVKGQARKRSTVVALFKPDDQTGHEYQIHESNDGFLLFLTIDGTLEAAYGVFEDIPMFPGDDISNPVEYRFLGMVPMFDDPSFVASLPNSLNDLEDDEIPPPEEMIGKFSNGHLTIYPPRIMIFEELKQFCGTIKNVGKAKNAKRR